MKIYIEGSSIFAPRRSGVGQYAKRLTEALLDELKKGDSLTVYGFMPIRPSTWRQMKAITDPRLHYRFIPIPAIAYNLFLKVFHIRLPVDALMLKRPDVIIFPNYFTHATWSKVKKAVVIHDLAYLLFPETLSPRNLFYLQKFLPRSVAESDLVVTISQSSKRQIMEHFRLPADKIIIAGPAVDTRVFYKRPAAEIKKARAKYQLTPRYILYHGTIEPRKNIEGLLEIYADLPPAVREEYGLVLAGGKGWQDETILAAIARHKKAGLKIIQTGYLPDDDAPALISGASLLVFPSLYEGFGMPPLEAMACGVPVITSDNSSLPEIVGIAGILLKAQDTAAWVAAITKVLADKDLQAKLIAAGHQQVKKFTWQKSAANLRRALDQIK